MASKYIRFDKSMTSIVKGFAIIFMIMLHFYGASNYDVPLDFSHAFYKGGDLLKICVGMFTFMVGYGYAFSQTKDLRYSLKHIKKLLIPYLTIFVVFMLPICYKDLMHEDVGTLVKNLFGFESRYYYYNWFVYYFIFAMLVMPFVSRFINSKALRNTIIVIIVSLIISVIIHEIPYFLSCFGLLVPDIVEITPLLALFFCFNMLPVTVLGYLFAHEGYYERINIGRLPKFWALVLGLALMALALILRNYWLPLHIPFQFDFFYAPMMIGGIVILFNKFKLHPLRSVLSKMGEVSVYMWFFQTLFTTPTVRWFYQPAITIFNDINLVVLWTIVLIFFASWLIKSVVDRVVSLVSVR